MYLYLRIKTYKRYRARAYALARSNLL